jgi:hypothetical protein
MAELDACTVGVGPGLNSKFSASVFVGIERGEGEGWTKTVSMEDGVDEAFMSHRQTPS